MVSTNKQANQALRSGFGRAPQQRAKPEADGLPGSVEEVMQLDPADLPMVAEEAEARMGELAEEYASTSLVSGALQARLALVEGGGE